MANYQENKPFKKKKVLLTGSAGFIGKRVSEVLLRQGYLVEPFDTKLGDNLLNKSSIEKKINGCRFVIHLAASLSENKKELEKINVEGTENLLECASRYRIERFLFLSTCGIYNINKSEEANENTSPNPLTPYEKSKLKGEEKIHEYQELVPFTILRLPLVMGATSNWKKIIKLAIKGQLVGDGKNYWQTIYVSDAADAIGFLLKRKDAAYQEYIVAGNEKPTLEEMYKLIRSELKIKGKISKIPFFPLLLFSYIYAPIISLLGEKPFISPEHLKRAVKHRNYSTKKLSQLGFRPRVNLKDSIKLTLKGLGEELK